MSSSLRVYGVPFSVHTRKVLLAARLKSIPHEVVPVVPVIPGNPPPNWRALSPTGLIPAIDDGGFVLADSTAILLYLDRTRPSPRLVPEEPRSLGSALAIDAWAGTALFRSVIYPLFQQQIVRPNIRSEQPERDVIDGVLGTALPEALSVLEQRAPASFLVGDALSIADLAVVSNLVMLHYLGHRIDAERHPKVAAYFGRHVASPLVRAALEAEQPFVREVRGLSSTLPV